MCATGMHFESCNLEPSVRKCTNCKGLNLTIWKSLMRLSRFLVGKVPNNIIYNNVLWRYVCLQEIFKFFLFPKQLSFERLYQFLKFDVGRNSAQFICQSNYDFVCSKVCLSMENLLILVIHHFGHAFLILHISKVHPEKIFTEANYEHKRNMRTIITLI